MPDGDRIEKDSLGEVHVPADALYGAQTQRAVDNLHLSGITMPADLICALGLIKAAAAAIAQGQHHEQFPVDVFQTGSRTRWTPCH